MKILILAPFSDLRSTIHGVTEGLEECGHKWDFVETKPHRTSVNIQLPKYAEYVAKKAESCDTVMIGKGTTIPLNIYKTMIDMCPDTTFLTFDSVSGDGCGPPDRPVELGARGLLCDRILLTGTEGARWFRQQGYEGRIGQVYQGCRHHIWQPGTLPRENQDRLCFLGSARYKGDGGRAEKFRAIKNAGFKLMSSKRIFHEDAAEAYWNSAICPNFTPGDITSNRVMRILSSGGFCLAERNADIDHSFTDGEELAVFNAGNIPHMIDQIRYYMNKPELRHEISMRGYEWTRDKSWTHQVEKMVRFIRGEDVPADGAAGEYVGTYNPTD